jgi:hypothetical protein
MARLYPRLHLLYELCLFLSKMHLEELAVGLLRVCCRKWRADYLCNLEVGYPSKPGHYVTSITYGEDLMALSGQGQRIDLR